MIDEGDDFVLSESERDRLSGNRKNAMRSWWSVISGADEGVWWYVLSMREEVFFVRSQQEYFPGVVVEWWGDVVVR